MTSNLPKCIKCDRNSDEVPLITITHQGQNYWICPQHFPILIHKPMLLVDKLPGVRNIDASEAH